jgi:Oxidoreductase-like protein, N-terminal
MLCRLPRAFGNSRPRAAQPLPADCFSKRSQYRPIIWTESRSVSNLSRSNFFDDRPVRSFMTSPRLFSSDENSSRPFPPIPSPPPSSNPNTTNSQSNTPIPLATIITGPIKPFDDKPKRDKSLPPEKPKPDECCSEYCVNCVWLQYIDELFVIYFPHFITFS